MAMDGSPFPPPAPGPGEGKPKDLWYIGAIINVIGSIAINLGTNLMKLGHNKRAKMDLPEAQKPPVRKIKEWVVGMTFFSIGNILNFVSFGFAAQSLLAALGSIQFVSNVIFAYFVLREQINRMVVIATTCIVGGCVLLVVFGNQSSDTYTVKELTHLYTEPAYVVYLCLLGVGVVLGYLLYIHGQRVVSKTGPRGFWYALLPVAYSIFSALIGTQSVLFSKSMSVILRLTFSGDNQLGNWYTWLVLPLFLMTAVFWITRLNMGLRMFPAMIIVPVMQIAWTLFSIVSGMLYFQEYLGFTPLKSVMFPIGVLVVFVGVFLLTQSGASKQPSYQKMEETAVAKALKQDVGHKAFGSKDAPDLELAQRKASIDASAAARQEVLAKPPAPEDAQLDAPSEVVQVTLEASPAKPQGDAGPGTERAVPPPSPIRSDTLEGDMAAGQTIDRQHSVLDNFLRRVRVVQDRLNKELLGVETRSGFRLAMGLGDGGMPGISLFAMPTVLNFTPADGASGVYPETVIASPKDESQEAGKTLGPIDEESEGQKLVRGATSTQPGGTDADEVQVSAQSQSQPQPQEGSPSAQRGSTGLGRSLINKAERAAKTSIEAIKRAPSNLQRAVREKQGYGSLNDDEETGLLQLTESTEDASGTKRR